ncbi:hypothetical protein H4S00_003583 [Coemansia sp. D1744]|nr:hypothetical protein H4S00_003583 [Coemansia sp. D1744]
MKILKYTALSIQLLVRATNVRASSELTLHGLVDPGATPTEASERMCPECIVRQMLPPELGLTVQQEASMTRRLASQVSQLIDEAALELNKPHAQVFESLEAIVRARGGRPRFDPSKLIDPKYTEEGKRLFGRMADLFRKFVAAYVTAVAENGLGSETTAPPTKTESTAVSGESSLLESTPSATLPPAAKIETKVETKTETKAETRAETTHRATRKSSSTKSRSKSHSSSDDDNDDDDDDKNDDEDDGDDDKSDDKSDKRFKNN